jgi:replication initiation protein RepC
MNHISTTPFGRRPMDIGLLAAKALAEQPTPATKADKWAIFRDLTEGRLAFGVTDRDLTLLAALLSFHREDALTADNLIVYPSNASLSVRAHGMAESTLRRHLAALVAAGLILRHDSPNGKRYAARDLDGEVEVVFGFSLKPLLVRQAEIAAAGKMARDAALRLKRLRERVVLTVRDAVKLATYAAETGAKADDVLSDLARAQRALRRRLSLDDLGELLATAQTLLTQAEALMSAATEEMDGNADETERHIQDSNTVHIDLEPCKDQQGAPTPGRETGQGGGMPLYLVLKACPELQSYVSGAVKTGADLVNAARMVRPMLGISQDAWVEAEEAMGRLDAAIVLAAILQNGCKITSPGGYLRALSRKARDGAFSPGPMIMALLNGANKQAV